MKFSPTEIKNLGELARLDLSPQEIATFSQQLSSIVDFIDVLNQAPSLASVSKAPLTNIWRADEPQDWDRTEQELALSQGRRESGFIVAPPALTSE